MKGLISTVVASMLLAIAMSVSVSHAEEDASHQDGVDTEPYNAKYVLSRRGTDRGEASRVLERLEDNQWRYFTSTSARMLLLSDKRRNETIFQMDEGRVKPLLFDYSREGTGRNRSLRVRFDYDSQQVVSEGDDPVEVEWQAGLLDPNAVLHQLQLDVAGDDDNWTYPLVNESGDFRDYEFERAGTETLELPYGTYETVRVDRVRDNESRQTLFWFAPELNYTLVKMQQIEDGREQLQIQLTELEMDDE